MPEPHEELAQAGEDIFVQLRRRYARSYYRANQEQVSARHREHKKANPVRFKAIGENYRKPVDDKAARKGEAWTAEDDRMAIRTDLTVREIASVLGRTYSEVCARRRVIRKRDAT